MKGHQAGDEDKTNIGYTQTLSSTLYKNKGWERIKVGKEDSAAFSSFGVK
jgi:hypothetical protein